MVDFEKYINALDTSMLVIPFGRIKNITATTITANGIDVAVGDTVRIESEQNLYRVLGMVTSIDGDSFKIVPFSFIDGFRINDRVFLQREGLSVKCGYGLLGRVLNALGEPIDGLGKLENVPFNEHLNKTSIPALDRGVITQAFPTGVKAIDSMLTSGKGQKVVFLQVVELVNLL